jgi:hypothetical protein
MIGITISLSILTAFVTSIAAPFPFRFGKKPTPPPVAPPPVVVRPKGSKPGYRPNQPNCPAWGLIRISKKVNENPANKPYYYPGFAGEGVDVYVLDTVLLSLS